MFMYVLLTFLLLLFSYKYFSTPHRNFNFPRGPSGIPVLGNIVGTLSAKFPHLQFAKWGLDYGKLYTVYLGTTPALVINDAKLLKKMLSLHAATGKFKTDTFLLITGGPYGILMMEEETHAEQRLFCIKSMKTFGFGGKSIQNIILPEVSKIVEKVSQETTIIPYRVMKQAISNTIWRLVAGEELCEEESTKVVGMLEDFIVKFQRTAETGLCFLPWLKHISKRLSGYTDLEKACANVRNYVEDGFRRAQVSWPGSDKPRHMMDCYLTALEDMKDTKQSSFCGSIGYQNCIASLSELFLAGVETTAAIMTWLMYYLIWIPDVTAKLCNEIDTVVGPEQTPTLEHKNRMPYTEAVILETQRHASVVPLGLIHELLENVEDFCGYSFPKGMLLIPNLYGIHHNQSTWTDPEIFRPERFIDNPQLKENFVGFQPGKRSCLAEPLAKDYMFLLVTHWFQKLKIERDPTITKEMYFDAVVGFGIIPKTLPITVSERFK